MFPFKIINTSYIAHAHTEMVKHLKFIKICVFRHSLLPPENPVSVQRHPAEIFSGTYYRDHTVQPCDACIVDNT